MTIQATVKGISLVFETDRRLFSPRNVDPGTLSLIASVRLEKADKVLDLGCGYGVMGISKWRILYDIRPCPSTAVSSGLFVPFHTIPSVGSRPKPAAHTATAILLIAATRPADGKLEEFPQPLSGDQTAASQKGVPLGINGAAPGSVQYPQ